MIVHYDSLSAFANACRETCKGSYDSATDHWGGDEHALDALKWLETGDDKRVPAAEALLDKIQATISLPERQWTSSPFGPVHVIPEVLSGFPMPSRRMILSESEGTPLRI